MSVVVSGPADLMAGHVAERVRCADRTPRLRPAVEQLRDGDLGAGGVLMLDNLAVGVACEMLVRRTGEHARLGANLTDQSRDRSLVGAELHDDTATSRQAAHDCCSTRTA